MYPDIKHIKAILLKENYISDADSRAAEAVARDSAGYIDYLIREELLTKSLLGQALAEAYQLPFADLGQIPPSKESAEKISEETARKNRVAFARANDTVVAIASDAPEKVDLQVLAPLFKGKKIRLAYTLPEYIEASFSLYEKPLATRFSQIVEAGHRVAPEIVDEIVKDALVYHASDIHLEPQEEGVIVRFRVDGVLREAGRAPREYYENILNRIKVASGMRIDEHLLAQDGALHFMSGAARADLRISLVPTVEGEKVVMRVLGSYVQSYTLADLGLSEVHRMQFETAAHKPFGMILTTGPTGSGKTTSLYALLKLLSRPDINITTIEDPVEYKMPGINQIQVRAHADMTFANGLRAIVRQDPDIILVGEIRDQETAEISVNAALTGHLLLSTFHANDAATAIPRLIDMGIEPFLLASTLELIIAQRLVRKICTHCRTVVSLDEALSAVPIGAAAARQYFSKADTVYTGKGCATCSGTGYQGRTALYELMNVTPAMQELITKNPTARQIATLARKEGDTSMFDDGVDKVKQGVTTITEMVRVVEPPEKDHGA
ncbi:MAG TPA: GspE/PulE family protein [Candidatus Saccharimonadales bacterium]|jgi:type IV pilus assembly protein PilB|nr:GspE/PulE family protein [Candidatus Saccharimonadales bacterium]